MNNNLIKLIINIGHFLSLDFESTWPSLLTNEKENLIVTPAFVMTDSNKINVVYEDLTPDYFQQGNYSGLNTQFETNTWWAEVRCYDGIFLPSGKFLHAVPDKKTTYGQAASQCERLGLTLVLPETASENEIINEYLSGNGFYLRNV